MLLRTLLLFLCVSSGLCATLGLLQIQAKDEDSPAEEATAVVDNAIPAVDENTQADDAADDQAGSPSPSVEDPGLLEKLFEAAADQVEVNAPIGDVAPAEELGTDSVNTPEEVPVVEAHIQEQPSEEEDNEIKPVQTEEPLKKTQTEENSSRWSLNSIRDSFQTMHGYFDSLVELVGGRDGVCEYRCSYGEVPEPRPGYQIPEPNGCSSSLVGFQLDLGIPAMTQCCNQLDTCYDTCGTSKYDCDSSFRSCLHGICSDLKKSLGLGTQVQTCESMADGLFNTVWTLGCRPYMNSQRAACICHGEEKDEL